MEATAGLALKTDAGLWNCWRQCLVNTALDKCTQCMTLKGEFAALFMQKSLGDDINGWLLDGKCLKGACILENLDSHLTCPRSMFMTFRRLSVVTLN